MSVIILSVGIALGLLIGLFILQLEVKHSFELLKRIQEKLPKPQGDVLLPGVEVIMPKPGRAEFIEEQIRLNDSEGVPTRLKDLLEDDE